MSCAWWWGRGTGWAGTRWCPPFGPPWPPPWTAPAPSPALWWLPTLRLGETLPLCCLLPLLPSVRSIVASPPSNDTPENFEDEDEDDGLLSISPVDHLNGNPWGLFTSLSEILSDWSSPALERDSHRRERRQNWWRSRHKIGGEINKGGVSSDLWWGRTDENDMSEGWRWSFVMNSNFKSCSQLRWMSPTMWRKLNS